MKTATHTAHTIPRQTMTKYLQFTIQLVIIPSLTLVKVKSGYRSSNYAVCSHFLFENDLCYFLTSSVLVLFMMLRMADFEINS